jgi:two-component system, sensor histidine kinase PdtaS
VNDAATQVLGFSRSEVVGKTFEEVGWMSGDDRTRILTALKYHDRIHNLELPMHRKDGETVHCNLNGEIVNHRGKRFLLSVAEDITEQKRFQEQLARSAREKEELLKELQHRVKNNLSLIAALLEFGMNSVSDERSKQAFVDAQSRIRTMSRMYEQLYQSSALKDIEADLYLSQLANSLVRTYAVNAGKIQLTLDLEPVKMDMKRMVPIGLIVNELVTNAVKYAFPDDRTGEVRLSFEKLNKHIVLSVSDDGVGLPKGIDVKRAESLGLSIVSMLADQIDAELVVTGTKGTTVSLTFEL